MYCSLLAIGGQFFYHEMAHEKMCDLSLMQAPNPNTE